MAGIFLTEKLLQFAVGNCWLRDAADHELRIRQGYPPRLLLLPELLILTLTVRLGLSTLAARSSLRTVGSCWGHHDFVELLA